MTGVSYSPYFVGIEKGIFLNHGIDLKLKTFPGAAQVIQAVQAGDAQFGVGTWSGIVPAREQGVDVVGFFFINSDPAVANFDRVNSIVIRPGVKAEKVQDLAGLTIASSFGGGTDVFLRAHLAKAGVAIDKVTLVNVTFPNMLSALQSGTDAAATTEPYGSLMEAKLPGSRILQRGGGMSDSRVYTFVGTDWLNKNRDLAEKVWAAAAASSQYARQHPDETAAAATHFLTGIDQDIVRKSLNYLNFDPRFTTTMEQSLAAQSQELVVQKKLKSAPAMESVLAITFMRSVQQKYPPVPERPEAAPERIVEGVWNPSPTLPVNGEGVRVPPLTGGFRGVVTPWEVSRCLSRS